MNKSKIISLIISVFLISCATFNTHITEESSKTNGNSKTLSHRFYFIGDAGNAQLQNSTPPLLALKKELEKQPENSTVVFLGDNIYDKGLPKKSEEGYELARHRIQTQIDAVNDFGGNRIFIPGNHDYYSDGIKGLQRQEKVISKALGKGSFLPKNSCPITSVKIDDHTALIIIDSQWYLEDWDKNPTMNNKCEIKTREEFFLEFESLIKKNRGKTTLVALHHPLITDGAHGGNFSVKQHLAPSNGVPLPVLGTIANFIRKVGGVSVQDVQNKSYRTLINRLSTISQNSERVVFVSGHEHSMQYLESEGIKQIVSGSGCKTSGVKPSDKSIFSDPNLGYVIVESYTDGSCDVEFIKTDEKRTSVFKKQIFDTYKSKNNIPLKAFEKEMTTAVYDTNSPAKSGLYKLAWGEHYRDEYKTPIKVETISLDTLFGGVTPIKRGGGNQSVSLRLKEDHSEKQWVMRALKKNAVQFLQITAYKQKYMTNDLKGSFLETFINDVYTAANPYSAFIMPTLSEAVGISYTTPKLYFVPKQDRLGAYNADYGDELYMIEEHVGKTQKGHPNFGKPEKIISSLDLFKKLDRSPKNKIDEEMFIKARLFDMVLGDWDRHQDQWRWGKFEEGDKNIYRPIPRDRDQVFSHYDGAMFGMIRLFTPAIKKMQKYENKISDIRWHNTNGSKVDVALIKNMNLSHWSEQARLLKSQLTDEVIEAAFNQFPDEIKNEKLDRIKSVLKYRRDHVEEIASAYFRILNKHVVLKATNKKDAIFIQRLPEGNTVVEFKQKGKTYFKKTYNKSITKEIWLYALDGEDSIVVSGEGNKLIDIKIIGGQKTDTYIVENGKKIDVIDYKSKNNNVEKAKKANLILVDEYDLNTYDYHKKKDVVTNALPAFGTNRDDGYYLGFNYKVKINKIRTDPFSQVHELKFLGFQTRGFDAVYRGEYANLLNKYNIHTSIRYTSPNYALNFFGYGNESINPHEEFDESLNYNRIKLAILKSEVGLVRRGNEGSILRGNITLESNELERTENRLIDEPEYNGIPNLFDRKVFLGSYIDYSFKNYNDPIFPTLGLNFESRIGATMRTNDMEKTFAYITPAITFIHPIFNSKRLVIANKMKANFIIGRDFEFYQAASIGGNDGMRGYRFQRFTGKTSFYNSTDIRFNFRKIKSGIAPMNMGIYTGFDIGRVWQGGENSDKWHNNYGGGLWLNFAELMAANLGVFHSVDDLRITFGLGFGI
ncbi:MAG: metallophosphoesterase [Flavobacteriales bacterium]